MLNKVLIADDDPEIRRIVRCYLESSGYDVSVVDNGRGALELVREEQPSYVITDWDMPEMSGLELCRQIRQMELFHYVYVVFLTGRSNEEDLVAAMDVGADDFLNKPLRKHELMARLKAGTRVLHLESRLSRLAANDALSGLLMRRAFVESAEKEWQRARRYRLPLSAVMLDIDFFKQVNDTHGHLAGDEVIRRVADLIRQNARSSDILCRYGGEEFCVLLTETEEVAATTWAERLRRIIADTTITYGETNMQVTVSLGVTGMLAEMEEKDEGQVFGRIEAPIRQVHNCSVQAAVS